MKIKEKNVIVPDCVHEAVLEAIEKIEQGEVRREKIANKKKVSPYRFAQMAAAVVICVAAVSTTSVAAIHFVRERMEQMAKEEKEQQWEMIYENRMGRDMTNRELMPSETERMNQLYPAYEGGRFPEGELQLISSEADYQGKGVAYLAEKGTFYFPEKEMSDEELLQLIDFRYKRDYSLSEINEEYEQSGIDIAEKASEAVKWNIPKGAVPYSGSYVNTISAGSDCIWIGSEESILRLPAGGSEAELYCESVGAGRQIFAICEKNNKLLLAANRVKEGDGFQYYLSTVDENGTVLQDIPLTGQIEGLIMGMLTDEQGNIYVKASGALFHVLNSEGELIKTIKLSGYICDPWWAMGMTNDGVVYRVALNQSTKNYDILSVNPDTFEVTVEAEDVYPQGKIAPEQVLIEKEVYYLWGYDGLYQYDLRTKEQTLIHAPQDYPITYEGVKSCVAKDGTLCLLSARRKGEYFFYYDSMGAAVR